MHTALAWVPRGKNAPHPTKADLSSEQIETYAKLANIQLDDARLEYEQAQREAEADDADGWEDDGSTAGETADAMQGVHRGPTDPDDLSAYHLESYDRETSRSSAPLAAFGSMKSLHLHRDAVDDPYVTLNEDDGADDERAELEIYPTDNLIVAAKTEDDLSQLDIYVYDESQENLYVHHDLLLPAMPICLEWLDFPPAGVAAGEHKASGSYIAVGTLDPAIEIWSLDSIDGMYPDTILGRPPGDDGRPNRGVDESGTPKTKRRKPKPLAQSDYHTDSVLALSWNRTHRHLLASASADATVKVWDLNRPMHAPASQSFDVHTDKVQALQWNPTEPTVLLSASWDKSLRLFDTRAPSAAVGLTTDCDIECLTWNTWAPYEFFISLENGLVQSFDSRSLSSAVAPKPCHALFTLSAHDKSVSALDYSPLVPGLLVTGGTDNVVKLWNVDTVDGQRQVSLLTSRDLGIGKVFAACFCPDDPATIAVAGSKGGVHVWDTATTSAVRKAFGDKLKALGRDVDRPRAGIVTLQDEGDSEHSVESDA